MPRVAVIIPFYQRESGILPVAVNSVLAQSERDFVVIVVDDGSPIPARDELASIMAQDNRVTIIERTNGGPGAARNTGLAAVPGDTAAIAFLDSDDKWMPDHLANGLFALDHGADFYFSDSDHRGRGMEPSRFAKCSIDRTDGQPIDGATNVLFYQRDLFGEVMRTSPVSTSSVIFRRTLAADRHFPEDVVCCEDKYFWMSLLRRTKKVAFSPRIEAVYGVGVNIYASVKWGAPAALRQLLDVSKIHRMIATDFRLNPSQRRWNTDWLAEVRRNFAANLLHLARRRAPIDWHVVIAYTAVDPRLLGALASTFVGAVRQHERNRF